MTCCAPKWYRRYCECFYLLFYKISFKKANFKTPSENPKLTVNHPITAEYGDIFLGVSWGKQALFVPFIGYQRGVSYFSHFWFIGTLGLFQITFSADCNSLTLFFNDYCRLSIHAFSAFILIATDIEYLSTKW